MPPPTAPPIFDRPPERILIIKPSAIGDVVHGLPVLNLLRQRWPAAHVSWMVTPACAGILEGHPQLNAVIPFDRKRYGRAWKSPGALRDFMRFNASLRRGRFDLVIDLQGLFRSGFLMAVTGAGTRVGSTASREGGSWFASHVAPTPAGETHAIERYLAVAEFLGLGREPVRFVFPTDGADRRYVDALLPPGQPIAVLLPATNWATKRWPIEHFAALLRPLRERFGLMPVLAGGPDAAAMGAALPEVLNLAGRTTLRQLTAVLERASLVVANDTGPMHIAAALGRPLVTMFGPTNPLRTGPYGRMETVVRMDLPCSPCYSRRCSHISCMKWLGAEAVLKIAEQQLRGSGLLVSSPGMPGEG